MQWGKVGFQRNVMQSVPSFSTILILLRLTTGELSLRFQYSNKTMKLARTFKVRILVFLRIDWIQLFQRIPNKEFEDMLEKHGGLYKPNFGYQNIFDSQENKSGWSNFVDIIRSNPINESVQSTIKNMKGQKKVLEVIQKNKHKEFLLQNENILKCYLYNNLVSKQAATEHPKVSQVMKNPVKHDTKDMVIIMMVLDYLPSTNHSI